MATDLSRVGVATPIGHLTVVVSPDGVVCTTTEDPASLDDVLGARPVERRHRAIAPGRSPRYFAGRRRTFATPPDLRLVTDAVRPRRAGAHRRGPVRRDGDLRRRRRRRRAAAAPPAPPGPRSAAPRSSCSSRATGSSRPGPATAATAGTRTAADVPPAARRRDLTTTDRMPAAFAPVPRSSSVCSWRACAEASSPTSPAATAPLTRRRRRSPPRTCTSTPRSACRSVWSRTTRPRASAWSPRGPSGVELAPAGGAAGTPVTGTAGYVAGARDRGHRRRFPPAHGARRRPGRLPARRHVRRPRHLGGHRRGRRRRRSGRRLGAVRGPRGAPAPGARASPRSVPRT